MTPQFSGGDDATFVKRVFIVLILIVVTVAIVAVFVATLSVLPVLFLAILLAIALSAASHSLSRRLHIHYRLGLAITIGAVVALSVLMVFLLGPRLTNQFNELSTTIPASLDQIQEELNSTEEGQRLLDALPNVSEMSTQALVERFNIYGNLTSAASVLLTILGGLILIVFIGIYMAIEPPFYLNNFVRLFPKNRRERMHEVLIDVGNLLARWLMARFMSMVVVGVLTVIGLLIIDMPLVLTLSIIAGLLSFIPNFGPFLGVAPAMLIGFTIGPEKVIQVAVVYFVVQQIENYLITPIIERETISLPPAMTLTFQLMMTIVIGQLGLIIAAPFEAMCIVLVKKLYVEDVLQDEEAMHQEI